MTYRKREFLERKREAMARQVDTLVAAGVPEDEALEEVRYFWHGPHLWAAHAHAWARGDKR